MTDSNREHLDRIEANLERLEALIEKNSSDLKSESKKWDERFYQLANDNLNLSRNIIIAAASAIIFSPLLKQILAYFQNWVSSLT